MITTAKRIHHEYFHCVAQNVVAVPGVINILGEHIEPLESIVIGCATTQRVCIAVSLRDDMHTHCYNQYVDELLHFSHSIIKYKKDEQWLNLIKASMSSLHAMGCSFVGCNISITGNLLADIGLSWNSAVIIGCIMGMNELLDLSLSHTQIIQGAYYAESVFMNMMACKSTYHIMLHARAGYLMALDMHTYAMKYYPFASERYDFLLVVSYGDIIMNHSDYIARITMCTHALDVMQQAFNHHSGPIHLREFTMKNFDDYRTCVDEESRRFCLHAFEEVERAHIAMQYLEEQDWHNFGKVMQQSHESLRDSYEITSIEIDWLSRHLVEQNGISGARLSGIGPHAMVCVLREKTALYDTSIEAYKHIFHNQLYVMHELPASAIEIVVV